MWGTEVGHPTHGPSLPGGSQETEGHRPNPVMATLLLPVTQELLGDCLGLSTVHINRVMQELRGRRTNTGEPVGIPHSASMTNSRSWPGSMKLTFT